MKRFRADLHIHTCLSPCAELEMTPRMIVKRAQEAGLDMIAISDHNSAENIEAALRAAEGTGLTVIPAMEINSREEAHVIGLFGSADDALRMQEAVYENLEGFDRQPGDWQVVVNEADEVIGFNRRFLLGATRFSLGQLVREIHARGGLAIACHVDRGIFSVGSQLGFVPADLQFDAFEVLDPGAAEAVTALHPDLPRIRSSDAHHPGDIGRRTSSFYMQAPSFEELTMALRGQQGRHVC